MATVPDLSGNRPNNAPVVDEHIETHEEREEALLETVVENTEPA